MDETVSFEEPSFLRIIMAIENDSDAYKDQFFYLNRWVDKNNFRAFVYDKDGNEKLANSYDEFERLTHSGIWFSSKEMNLSSKKVKKNGSLRPDS